MFNFKKIASVLTSAVMLSSTIGFAAAATYPAPFVAGGTADTAIIYGSNAPGVNDFAAAVDLQESLQGLVTSGTTTTASTVSGEAAGLFTGGTKLYINDSLNAVVTTLTKTQLPTVLEKGTFSGNVEATYEQIIDIGTNPSVTFNKQPTSSDDPEFGLTTSTTSGNIIYNASVTFNKAVNFTHADSKGQDIMLFGQKFTVASATDSTNLVLLKTAEKVSLSTDEPSADVTIGGSVYTVELISASDTAATIKVTDSSGKSETKEINEAASKKVNGVTIAVINADETNLKLSANIIAGAEKVTLSTTAASNVKIGDTDKTVDGTSVTITGGTTAATKIVFGVFAKDSDNDAVLPGKSYVDPVFGTIKLDFTELNIASSDTVKREDIKITPSGDDKIEINFLAGYGTKGAKSIQWAKNLSNGINLQVGDDSYNITVTEMEQTFRNGYIVVGNEESGRLVKVSTISNDSSTTPSSDTITFSDVFTEESISASAPSTEGSTSVVLGGKTYTVTYGGTGSSDSNWVRLKYPTGDSPNANSMVLYPTIKTSKGAKLAFYEPKTINLISWDGNNTLSSIRLPDGDGYTAISLASHTDVARFWNVTFGTALTSINTTAGGSASGSIGRLTYNVTVTASAGSNTTTVYLVSPEGGNIVNPALILFEEKDDNTNYEALVVTLDPGASSSNGLDVADIVRTWGADGVNDQISTPGNSNIAKEADLFGTIITRDTSSSGHAKAVISYPDEQIYASIFIAENSAVITPGSSSTGTGGTILIRKDTEITSVATKNLIVVGGSCINQAAAKILGSQVPMCEAEFTAATGNKVAAGQYIIKVVAASTAGGSADKVAMLVAGYEAVDTNNAVAKVKAGGFETVVGTEVIGPTTA